MKEGFIMLKVIYGDNETILNQLSYEQDVYYSKKKKAYICEQETLDQLNLKYDFEKYKCDNPNY